MSNLRVETIRLTTAQALIRFLNSQFVDIDGEEKALFSHLFSIFGHGNVLGIGQAMEENPGHLILHQGRNEQGMGHAAMAFAKQHKNRQLAVCTSSVGPGAANMVTAAATATANRIPVLFLPGDTYACRQPDPVLQQIEQFHDLNITTNDAFKAVSKFWDRINRADQLMSSMVQAIRTLLDPSCAGAVTIALPQDVQGEVWDYPLSFFRKRVHSFKRPEADKESVSKAIQWIEESTKPMLICGGGVLYSDAADQLESFSNALHIPVGETQAGKGAMLSSFKWNVGGIGTTGGAPANLSASQSDLIIAVGTRLSDFTTASKWLFSNPDVKIITINITEFDAIKMEALPLVGDARAVLAQLCLKVDNQRSSQLKKGWMDRVKLLKRDWIVELNRLASIEIPIDKMSPFTPEVNDSNSQAAESFVNQFGKGMSQTQALAIINNNIEENSIIVGSSGSLPGDLQRVWQVKSRGGYHMEYGYSCMGYEINGAFGAKIAEPQRPVYAMVGDGSFMMGHSELVTSLQDHLPIIVLLFDNCAFGCINNLQHENAQQTLATEMRYRGKEGLFSGELIPIDYAMVAAGYGCQSWSVSNADELKSALIKAQKATVSSLIDIKVLPKTMTHGYEGFWRVGNAEIAVNSKISDCNKNMKGELKKAFRY